MRHREEERDLYQRLWNNVQQHDFKIRELIRAIVTSPEYLGTVETTPPAPRLTSAETQPTTNRQE